MANEKLNISAVLISLISLLFFLYIAMFMFKTDDWMKAVGMLSICGLFLVNLINKLLMKKTTSYTWQWIFILIALVLWLIHSFLYGKFSALI